MYDLSGMQPGEEQLLLKDIAEIAERYSLKDHAKNPSYLYHNGKPLVTVWGVGFNDNRRYGLKEAAHIIDGLKSQGFSVMLGVPTQWRTLNGDTESDPRLHELIRKCYLILFCPLNIFFHQFLILGISRFIITPYKPRHHDITFSDKLMQAGI